MTKGYNDNANSKGNHQDNVKDMSKSDLNEM